MTPQENEKLEEIPSLEELKNTVFDMNGGSAASPDSFTCKFFTATWDIIGQHV